LDNRTTDATLEIIGVKVLRTVAGDGWYASVTVRVAQADDRVARGWVHVRPRGTRLVVDDWDSSDASDIGRFGEVIQTEADAIVEAVNAKLAVDRRLR